ncbi:PRP1 splicing factor, N-terminal-domain-containing protein [Pholiota molesta]|nr:PRP1 splicing factor, N-terminal-domain-containing protein [Pholiota molesta]
MAQNKPNKLAFLSMPAPASYVAGLGRGASGFTTRSDIGPAREGPSAEVIAEAQARRGEEAEVDPDQFQDPDNEYGLFAGTTYEQDDEEADRIYESVDDKMDSRRRKQREAAEQAQLAKHRAERPKIQQQFADLKRGLSSVTDAEWESIPEVGNLTRKKRRRTDDNSRTYVVPDSVLVGDRSKVEYETALDARQQAQGGFETPADGGLTNFSDAEIGDIKRARMLFDSLVKSNPKHAPGWIAAACLEEHAGRMVKARKIIKMGCEECKTSEDVWLEAARLHNNDDAKVILANAVQHVGQSHDVKAKKRVLRKALEHIPNSVRLWKETVNLESSAADARILLARAVEVIPLSVELWLALARLETPERAKAVLNKARKAVPTSHEFWIAAARLLEQEAMLPEKAAEQRDKELAIVDKTIEAATRNLRQHRVLLTREQWLKEAETCEAEGSPRTCEAIVKATVGMDVEEEDRLDTWVGDAESAEGRGRVGAARAILAYALRVYPDRRALWRRAADLEKAHGTRATLDALLERAVAHCPQAEVLWLMAAKEKWLAGDVPAAREVLERAFVANPESEQIWLAAVKLEAENGEFAVARELLIRARSVADTERIWMKSAVFERQQGQLDTALDTLRTALSKFPKFSKLYMIQGQIYESQGNIPAARAAFAAGTKATPKEPTLWILAARLEERDGKSIKARAILDKARLVNPANDRLWAEAVGVEERSGGAVQAKAMLARALQECAASGLLWAMALWAEPRASRKTKSVDALRATKDSPLVVCTVARVLWADRVIERARDWFGRASVLDPDLGDVWGWWLKFERQHGNEEQREIVRTKCIAAEPHHGAVWQAIAKDVKNVGKSTKEILEMVADELK